ncbi:MAG TPA: hypothetical protein VF074_10975 [Pyrinomonadaceae bacterium]
MKSIIFICSLTLLLLVMSPVADADIARPKPSPNVNESRVVLNTVLQIVPDTKISDARLQIPQSELKSLRAALDSAAGNTTVATSIGTGSIRTIIAGLLLFASISIAGVWLARTRGKNGETNRAKKVVAVMLIGISTIGAAAIITRGNAGPPAYYRWRNLPQSLMEGKAMSGSVTVEIVPDDPNSGSQIKLLIPLRKTTRQGEE